LLTSKEIIERTGISRATLNNYIASGLLPRPQVLPPGPEHGDAPRIGYFPDDAVERVETIQRLKRQGWSITRIAEHFAGGGAALPVPAAGDRPVGAAPTRAPAPVTVAPEPPAPVAARIPEATAAPARAAPVPGVPALRPVPARQVAYLVDDAFRLVWANEEARTSPLSPLAHGEPAAASVFRHLLHGPDSAAREALLRFHLEAARSRGAGAHELFAGLPVDGATALEALYRDLPPPASPPLLAHELVAAAGVQPRRWVHAVHFHEGVLFTLSPPAGRAAAAPPPAAPTLTPVAVLVAMLQDAAGLWVRLAAEEYFELLNEVCFELDAVFRQQAGRSRPPAGEALVCYFLPAAGASYMWNALAAALQAREAMRQLSQRWQVRKGWDVELRLNIGIDEGQDWLGELGVPGEAELRVLGDAADRAEHLARCSRMGAILLTRNLVGKLSRQERQRVTYGAPRLEGTPGEAPLLFTFARLGDVAAPSAAPAAVADLAVAELIDLTPAASHPHGGAH